MNGRQRVEERGKSHGNLANMQTEGILDLCDFWLMQHFILFKNRYKFSYYSILIITKKIITIFTILFCLHLCFYYQISNMLTCNTSVPYRPGPRPKRGPRGALPTALNGHPITFNYLPDRGGAKTKVL